MQRFPFSRNFEIKPKCHNRVLSKNFSKKNLKLFCIFYCFCTLFEKVVITNKNVVEIKHCASAINLMNPGPFDSELFCPHYIFSQISCMLYQIYLTLVYRNDMGLSLNSLALGIYLCNILMAKKLYQEHMSK